MIDINLLKLLNALVVLEESERKVIYTSNDFKDIREQLSPYVSLKDDKDLIKQIETIILMFKDYYLNHIDCIKHTNLGISNYLSKLSDLRTKTYKPLELTATICSLGNADTNYSVATGISNFKEFIISVSERYLELLDVKIKDLDKLNACVDAMDKIQTLSNAVVTFMIAKYGSANGGSEHFGVNVESISTDLAESNDDVVDSFNVILEDPTTNDLDHYGTMIEGLEHYVTNPNKDFSYAQRYLNGVLISHGVRLNNIEGNEGAIWDKVKTGLQKAYVIIRDGLTAMKENYFDKSLQVIADETSDAANANKKALNAVSAKDATLADKVKGSIKRLGDNTKNQDVINALSGLSTVTDAPNVIDKLMIAFTKVINEGTELEKEFNQIDSDLKALESSTTSDTPDDEDKEAIQIKKQAISTKSKELKDSFNELKTKLNLQRTNASAISKAIKGITPSIFVAPNSEDKE